MRSPGQRSSEVLLCIRKQPRALALVHTHVQCNSSASALTHTHTHTHTQPDVPFWISVCLCVLWSSRRCSVPHILPYSSAKAAIVVTRPSVEVQADRPVAVEAIQLQPSLSLSFSLLQLCHYPPVLTPEPWSSISGCRRVLPFPPQQQQLLSVLFSDCPFPFANGHFC